MSNQPNRVLPGNPSQAAASPLLARQAAVTLTAPHLRSRNSTHRLLVWYVLASLPVLLFGLWGSADPLSRLAQWLPLLGVSMAVGLLWETLFARRRGRASDPTWAVAAWLFALLLPGGTPLWIAGVALSFGLIIGHHIFGGLGRALVSPALLAALFVHFSYPGLAAAPLPGAVSADMSWASHFTNHPSANLAGASALASVLGALILVRTRAASWRTLLGALLGTAATGGLFNLSGSGEGLGTLSWHWHLALGNLAFAAVFLATDPSTAALTRPGRWFHGVLAGCLTVLIRLLDPTHPDGALFAILLAGLSVPLLDYTAVRLHVARRNGKAGASGG